MDIKKKSQTLKKRAKELGYEIKLTHAQEMISSIYGHDSRHSALLDDKNKVNELANQKNPELITLKINKLCQVCKRKPRKYVRMLYNDSSLHFICEDCSHGGKFSEAKDLTDKYKLDRICLEDVDLKDHPTPFTFNLVCLDGTVGDKYLFVPNLEQGYTTVKVWNLSKNKSGIAHWDWEILIDGQILSGLPSGTHTISIGAKFDPQLRGYKKEMVMIDDSWELDKTNRIKKVYEELSGNTIKEDSIFDSSGHLISKYSLDIISNFLEAEVCDWDCNCPSCRDIKNLLYK